MQREEHQSPCESAAEPDLNSAKNPQLRTGEGCELVEITEHSSPELREQARQLLLEYGQFVIARPHAGRFCLGTLQKEADELPDSYQAQGGGCLLARVNGSPMGFVAWRALHLQHPAWELKRLWVRPQARGLNLGRTLTQAVIDHATAAGLHAVYLDTIPTDMPEAHRLYLSMGFTPTQAYNDNPVDGLAYLVRHLDIST